jgi:hypothetical protein
MPLSLIAKAGSTLLVAVLLLGCSADSAPAPEPTFTTPGAFIAFRDESGGYLLMRTLAEWPVRPGESVLFVSVYSPTAATLDEARELAQGPPLPLLRPDVAVIEIPDPSIATVVWFRTLTPEEMERVAQ